MTPADREASFNFEAAPRFLPSLRKRGTGRRRERGARTRHDAKKNTGAAAASFALGALAATAVSATQRAVPTAS